MSIKILSEVIKINEKHECFCGNVTEESYELIFKGAEFEVTDCYTCCSTCAKGHDIDLENVPTLEEVKAERKEYEERKAREAQAWASVRQRKRRRDARAWNKARKAHWHDKVVQAFNKAF